MKLDENTSGHGLLKYPSSLSYSDPFVIIEDNGFTFPPINTSTNSSTYILELTGICSTLNQTVTSLDHSSKRNDTSPNPYLRWWAIKMIEVDDIDVGDILIGR